MAKSSRSKSPEDVSKMDSPNLPLPPKYLSENSLPLYTNFTGNHISAVPPMSPKELIFDYSYTRLPKSLPKLKNFKLPYVREIGIKACIDRLAEYFRCTDYKFNLLQFWFLDIITDCLWRAQDEYQFPEKYQKIILEWVLYIFNLIRASEYNLSRKRVFELFKEAMLLAEDYIQSGCSMIPLPEDLFVLRLEENTEGSSTDLDSSDSLSSDSTISLDSSPEISSYLAIKFEENTEFFKLPEKTCIWDGQNECLSSSEETMSEEDKPQLKPEIELKDNVSFIEDIMDEEIEFYKPDLSTPPRFKPSHESIVESASISLESIDEKASDESQDAVWKDIPRRPKFDPCPPVQTSVSATPSKVKSKNAQPVQQDYHEADILKAWYDYYLWQIRTENMANPNVGLTSYSDTVTKGESVSSDTSKIDEIKKEWVTYIKEERHDTRRLEENIFVNTCVLMAIKQFVFDYFYETFQYTLIRIAYRYPHHLITQSISEHWHVPKHLKSELKKPKPKKPKKEKKQKEKKPPKEKKPKEPKEKASKKGKAPKEGKEKKEKKEKPKQLSKEEKAELARLKKEQEMEEERKRTAELNRRFLFPLSEAATDAFYGGIFEDWVKVEKSEKGKKQKGKK